MTRTRPQAERWVDPIVAEVRAAREGLFAAAGFDLEEWSRRLNEQQQREGRASVTRHPRPERRPAKNGARARGGRRGASPRTARRTRRG